MRRPARSAFSARPMVLLLLAIIVAAAARPVSAYLKLGTSVGGRVVSIRWNRQPVRYMITNRDVPRVSAPDLQQAIAQGFQAWAGAPSVSVAGDFVGYTTAEPVTGDGASVVGFQSRPDLDRVLGATTFTLDSTTGEILESDIFLNSAASWSVASAGDAPRFDVASIVTHELGHLLGLGHSALGETTILPTGGRRVEGKRAVMFPIAFPGGNIEDRTLEADDIAGVQEIYASASSTRHLGSIAGRVTMNGTGVYGAHVAAFNPRTGALVGGFSLGTNGQFVIGELEPGIYVVRAEPLDDVDVASFLDETTAVNVNFTPAYAPSLVSVPGGGSAAAIEIKVQAK